ncbi:MAG: hypothetical protein ACLR4Z_05245 [Butyricicoccaceae bacterium]
MCQASSLKPPNIIKLQRQREPVSARAGRDRGVCARFDAAKLAVYPDANAKALKTVLAER